MKSYFFLGELFIILKKRFLSGKRLNLRPLMIFLGLVLLILWAFMAIERSVLPTLIAVSESKILAIANQAIIEAINCHVDSLMTGIELLDFHTGTEGQLQYVRTNTVGLNKIQAESLSILQQTLGELDGFRIYVPLGQVLGSNIFASRGPKIGVTLIPYGHVKVNVVDSFEVTGINQIKYSIALNITYTVQVVIPFISTKAQGVVDIPVAAVLIPGKVPETYLSLPFTNSLGP